MDKKIFLISHLKNVLLISVPPQKTSTLPDLYRLLESMEGEGDLNTEKQPPSLFARPEHVTTYQKISGKS